MLVDRADAETITATVDDFGNQLWTGHMDVELGKALMELQQRMVMFQVYLFDCISCISEKAE